MCVHLSFMLSFYVCVCVCVCSPLKLLNRHNEVWYVAEGEPVCTDPQEPTPAHTTRTTTTNVPTESPSDPQPDTLSDSPSLPLSNLSSNSTFNSTSQLLSDAPTLPPSKAPASHPSILPSGSSASRPPPSTPISLDPAANTSDPVSVSPLLELQPDTGVWNSTAHTSVDTKADHDAEAHPDDAH